MADALVGYALFGLAPFACIVVGALYLASIPAGTPALGRVASVSYAPASALLYLAALLGASPARDWTPPTPLFFAVQAVPLALMGVGIVLVRQPRWVHRVLVPVALLSIAWQVTWSYFSIYGK